MEPISTCQGCSAAIKSPHCFTCGHFMCSHCIKKILFFDHLEEITTRDLFNVKCKCNSGTREISLADVQLMLLESNNLPSNCVNHKASGKSFCMVCEKWFCEACLEMHNQIFSQHQLTDSHIYLSKCKEHEEQFKHFYCLDCEENICELCTKIQVGKHSSHKYQSVKDYSSQFRTKMQIGDISSTINHIDQIAVKFKDSMLSVIDFTISKFDQLLRDLEETKTIYISKVMKTFERADILGTLIHFIYSDFKTTEDISLLRELGTINGRVSGLELKDETSSQLDQIKEKIKGMTDYFQSKVVLPCEPTWCRSSWSLSLTMWGHSQYIYALIQLQDGRVVSGSWDNTIKIWEVGGQTYQNTQTLIGHTDWVCSLLQLRDGRIASGSKDKAIKIWEGNNTNLNFSNTLTLTMHSNTVLTLIQLKDGRTASGAKDFTIGIWEINQNDFKLLMTLTGHSNSVRSLLQLRDGHIVSGSDDSTIKIWEVGDWKIQNTMTLTGHTSFVGAILQLKDGRMLSGSNDTTLKVWEILGKSFGNTLTLTGHTHYIMSLIQLKDGLIASASCDNTLKIWQVQEKYFKIIQTLTGHTSSVATVIQLKDGRLASGSDDHTVKIWKLD